MMLITFIFFIVGGQLVYLQIVKGKSLQAKALDQWTRDVPLGAVRGQICDCNGVELAGCNTTYTLYVRPNATENKQKTAEAIAQTLSLDYEKVLEKVSKKGVSEVTVAKKVSKEQMLCLIASGEKGMYFSRDVER